MRKKEVSSKKSKKLGGNGSPPERSKIRPIKKQKEKSILSEIRPETNSHETKKPAQFVSSMSPALNVRIQARAYELYERRGGHYGQDVEDWVEAERQILSEAL